MKPVGNPEQPSCVVHVDAYANLHNGITKPPGNNAGSLRCLCLPPTIPYTQGDCKDTAGQRLFGAVTAQRWAASPPRIGEEWWYWFRRHNRRNQYHHPLRERAKPATMAPGKNLPAVSCNVALCGGNRQGNCKVQGFALETEKMYRFLAAMPPKTYTFSLWRGKAAPHAAAKGDFAVALRQSARWLKCDLATCIMENSTGSLGNLLEKAS
jgi:hypothetical protein